MKCTTLGSLHPNWKGCPDSYSVRDIVGSGSYSEVAAASFGNDGDLEEAVAIKRCTDVFDKTKMPRGALVAYREMSILRCLSKSPHIVTLRDAFRLCPQTQDLFLVFDHAERDLDSFIKSPSSSTSVEELYSIAHQLFKGVQHMHQAHIIHRDLKPQNVLVFPETETGAGAVLKICDFGLARVVTDGKIARFSDSSVISTEATEDSGSLMATNSLLKHPADEEFLPTSVPMMGRQLSQNVMTRNYRCPELIQAQDYNSSVDLWSCGCILAELLDTLDVVGKMPDQRSAIFPGTASSFPPMPDPYEGSSESTSSASEDNAISDGVSSSDHLKSILKKLGYADKSDCSDGAEMRQYLKSNVAERNANQALEVLYTRAPVCFIHLLQRLLCLNPERRATAWEAVALLESSELPAAQSIRTSDPLYEAEVLLENFDLPPEIQQTHCWKTDEEQREFNRIQNSWCCIQLEEIVMKYPSGKWKFQSGQGDSADAN